ncbi:MAG TPA: hypothetical protein VFB52_10030, partial [Solirubrobacterales bacterium]|nr:hypothetical protein [Solirubrobacterales bacterium]
MRKLNVWIAVLAVSLAAAIVSGCGDSTSTACVVVDASHSTRYALPDYLERLESSVLDAANAGESVAALVATGQPLVESKVETEDFSGLTSSEDIGERNALAQEFLADVDGSARDASLGTAKPAPGSGIVAAISLVSTRGCDSMLVLSDGLEAADVRMKVDDILSVDGRTALLDKVEQRGRLPRLEGMTV